MLRTKPDGNGGFDENSYRSADEVNAIRWDNLSKPEHSKTIDYYRGLIAFRKAHSALRSQYRKDVFNSVQMIPFRNQHVVLFRVQDEEKEIFLIFNASSEAVSVNLPAGSWDLMIHDDMAGTNSLAQKTGTVEVAPISATVLTRAK